MGPVSRVKASTLLLKNTENFTNKTYKFLDGTLVGSFRDNGIGVEVNSGLVVEHKK